MCITVCCGQSVLHMHNLQFLASALWAGRKQPWAMHGSPPASESHVCQRATFEMEKEACLEASLFPRGLLHICLEENFPADHDRTDKGRHCST